ncbi:phosphatase PAP2 family protein [Actinoplanes sp. N902-109]|uniref:phosphatase PAP2 family protein n=1 Tax=Actinoplanes sp. (strain N902-109) TaxID=649831 RepID=UPI0003295C6D|nr:phosphatase PAP2 family protein [Actinoplanes sp. N902-109]AGL15910.1 phosphoesterase pa-phosphatase-like protein [Actinoplanes sp. N902-109]
MSEVVVQFLKRIFAPVLVLFVVMVGLGLLITKVLEHTWPFTVEDAVNRDFAHHRDGAGNAISYVFSTIGSTPVIIGVTAVVAVILRLTLKRWREPLFLCGAVSAQALIFFFTTLVIDRHRPTVSHLDSSPPTSSFPSGHTSASVALYVGMALVLAGLTTRGWLKAVCWLLVLVPVGVALGRLYRGMHHPSDVTASFFNGITCVWIMARGILDRSVKWARRTLRPAGPGRLAAAR